ncbi:cysteine-rich receptor-like protein kinase 25 isoform X2 [Zingiber officinale]|uniref:cysteine-rich receptor-like protein kinase 25 isoform X2 n=1 Tax=Zingiber officinale TaxID=94328 RepID=UPI001C4CF59D|nr:cysteine-rich receptor-like protein kinase 25 isoform X2 [Zingiber officinale]
MRICVLIVSFVVALRAAVAQLPLYNNCTGGTFDSAVSGGFGGSLSALFSSLASASSASNAANDTAGAGSDAVYGLYMCQGDLFGSDCLSCVQMAIAEINQSCAGSRRGDIWYDQCLLRYSDLDFFGQVDSAGLNMSNPGEQTSSMEPYEMMSALVEESPFRRPLMFASNASDLYPIFAIAQCTSDLTSAGCQRCLTSILAFTRTCCLRHKGWRYISPSCWIRYEATPFFAGGDYSIIRSRCSDDDIPAAFLASEQSNLQTAIAELESNANSSGFYNTTTGDRRVGDLFALALCREDPAALPSSACTGCLHRASAAMAGECPNKTQGIMWYDDCLLRYSNQSIFNVVDVEGSTFCSDNSVSSDTDNITITGALALVEAAVGRASLFASGIITLRNSNTSYVTAQCTRDLSRENCRSCLGNAMSRIVTDCRQRRGWQFLSGSCMIRYEVYPFFNLTASTITITAAAPPPALSAAPPPALGGGGGNPSREGRRSRSSNVIRVIAIVLPIVAVLLLFGMLLFYRWKLRRKRDHKNLLDQDFKPREMFFFDFDNIKLATNDFSNENKLGEGGFGPVYKGVLRDGTEIAVKRLSEKSKQGPTEFKNEVKLIAKLQHKNLVRMLGCCVEGEEKLLIYELLPNNSLDAFLFDANKRAQLNWERRFLIISGIAKGLLYLHEDSLLKVIHRDLKASNILLDSHMNAKISDFGMAKIYLTDENVVNTNRIVGTFGYMAPEYAMDGVFSVKSDVYSFGVLLLEIISSERNGRAHLERHGQNLLRTAWDLWKEDKAIEFIDQSFRDHCPVSEVVKCIHIGLLCVQENAEERPTMFTVVVMLRTENMELPPPGQPSNFVRKPPEGNASSSSPSSTPSALQSVNEVTESQLAPR